MQALKIILIGDTGVGKSQLSRCVMNKPFVDDCQSTVGMEFQSKKFDFEKCVVTSLIWDTAGQERFANMTRAYYRDAVAAILVYDVCNRDSLIRLETVWMPQLKEFGHASMRLILVGNKIDKVENGSCTRDVSIEEGIAFAAKLNVDFVEASARTQQNVEKMFRRISLSVAKLLPDIKMHLELLDLPEGWLCIMPPPPPPLVRESSSGSGAGSDVGGVIALSPSSSMENILRPPLKTNSFHDSPESFRPVGIDSSINRRRSMRKDSTSPTASISKHQAPKVRYVNYWTGEEVDEKPCAPADAGLLFTTKEGVSPSPERALSKGDGDVNDILRDSLGDLPTTERSSSARTLSLEPSVQRKSKVKRCCIIL